MSKTDVANLDDKISSGLPAELVHLIQAVEEIAQSRGEKLYLVGGAVRDLLLGRASLDIDLVVESDAIGIVEELAKSFPGKVTKHSRFGTAKLEVGKWSVDIATARSETYSWPGALPTVKPGMIEEDLFRRDFTINAMAVELDCERCGRLLDPYGGRVDLKNKVMRVLHEKSFIDDATRIWRAVRYEQRLDFRIEPRTLKLIKRDLGYLDTISGDRIRQELELVLKEESPEKALLRADELGVLRKAHPALRAESWLVKKFAQARRQSAESPSVSLYLALLAYRLAVKDIEKLIAYLKLLRKVSQTLKDTVDLKVNLGWLERPGIKPSEIYAFLQGYSPEAIAANAIANESPVVRKRLDFYSGKLCMVKPALTGRNLREMGIEPGLKMKEILLRLLEARLDGRVKSRNAEEELVKKWLGGK